MKTKQINKITLAEPKQFIELFKFYNKCNDNNEVTLFFDKEKRGFISFREMNGANTLLTNTEISSSIFTEWDVEKCKKGIIMNTFIDFLRRVKVKEDILQIEFNDTDYKMTIKNTILRKFESKVVDWDNKEEKMPNLSHKAKIRLTSKQLYDAIKDIKGMDKIEFIAENKKLIIKLYSGYEDNVKDKIEIREDGYNSIETTEKLSSKFTFDLLKKAITNRLSEDVTLFLSQDYPILIRYLEVDKFKVDVVIAPNVDIDKQDETFEETGKKDIANDTKESDKINREVKKIEHQAMEIESRRQKKASKTVKKAHKKVSNKKIDLKQLDDVDDDFVKFSKKYSTPLGEIKNIVEEKYNSDIEFMQFAIDEGLLEELNNNIDKFLDKKLEEYFKKFKIAM